MLVWAGVELVFLTLAGMGLCNEFVFTTGLMFLPFVTLFYYFKHTFQLPRPEFLPTSCMHVNITLFVCKSFNKCIFDGGKSKEHYSEQDSY